MCIPSFEVLNDPQPSSSMSHNNNLTAAPVQKDLSHISKQQASISNYIQRPIPMTKTKMIDAQLVKMIVKEYHPFSIVEDKEFRKLINMLCPSYSIPFRKTVTQNLLPQMYEMTLECVKDNIKNVTAVCLTTDCWTSINNESFIAVTAHFIDPKNETQLSSVLLGCNSFDEKHTAGNLARYLRNTVDDWNLSDKLTGVVSDNAANIRAAIVKNNWRYLSCFAHSINLVVQSSLNSIEPIIYKVKAIVQFFKKSSHALVKLHDFQKQTGSPLLKLKQDCPTRWNSTYDMIDRIISIKDPIIATLAILNNSEVVCLSPQDWVVLEHARNILKIFYDVTVEISAEKYVSISKEIIFIKVLNKYILNFINDDTLPNNIKTLAQNLKTKLHSRFGNIEDNILVTQATLLDPRFKNHVFSDNLKCTKAISMLRAKAQSIIINQNEPVDQPTLFTPRSSSSALWEEFDETVENLIGGSNSSVAGIVEVDKYLNEPLISRYENPLVWWVERKKIYPRLYELVKRRACIVATSVPCERIFSKAGQVITTRRNRLSSTKVSQILFLNHNM